MNDVRDMDAQEYAMSGMETRDQQEAEAAAERLGPWRADGSTWIRADHRFGIRIVGLGGYPDVTNEEVADIARLIAAAPDLLEALEDTQTLLEMHLEWDHPTWVAARDAIAAARGTAPNPEPAMGHCEQCGYPRYECTCYSR